jgi:hypothetical protein
VRYLSHGRAFPLLFFYKCESTLLDFYLYPPVKSAVGTRVHCEMSAASQLTL